MEWIILAGVYLTGWLAASTVAMRRKWEARQRDQEDVCPDPKHCRRGLSQTHCLVYHAREPRPFTFGDSAELAAVSLLWPVLLIPAMAYGIATRKPKPKGVDLERAIAALEREAGIE